MNVLMPLPLKDFDPTEVAITWAILSQGCHVVFATPEGVKAEEDRRMISGQGLGILSRLLRANREGRLALEKLKKSKEFNSPISYKEASKTDFDGIVLSGGHAPGMRPYLESEVLQEICKKHMDAKKPMGAICHGILVLARTNQDGHSLLYGRKVTALPKSSELIAWNATKAKLGNYYRTYPDSTVEDEVLQHLKGPKDYIPGGPTLIRDSLKRLWAGHVVVDENLVTARWPGDTHRFALRFKELLT